MPIFKRSKKKEETKAPRPAQELLQEEALPSGYVEEMVQESEFIIPAPKDVMLSTGSDEEMSVEETGVVQAPEGGDVIIMGSGEDGSADNSFPKLDAPLDDSLREAVDESLEDLRAEEEALAEEMMEEPEIEEEVVEEVMPEAEEITEDEKTDLEAGLGDDLARVSDLEEVIRDLQAKKTAIEAENISLEEDLRDLQNSFSELEKRAQEKEEIDRERISSLEEQIESLSNPSLEDEKKKDLAMRERIEGLLKDLTPEGSENPDFKKLNTLLQSVEEYHDFLRAEKERMETLHSLAEMELQRAREQTLESEKSKGLLEREREEVSDLRNDLERELEVVRAEKEKVQLDGVETTRALSGAREREKRTETELAKAQEARDVAEDARREAELLKRKAEIEMDEALVKKNEIAEQERRVADLEKSVQERNEIAEEQRNYSSQILENLTDMRRALERSRAEVEAQQEHLRDERAFYEQERLATEKKKEEYDQGIVELTASREGVVDELERARQTREEAEREREVLSEELRGKIHAAGEEAREARDELSSMRQDLEKAERELSESERERHELRAEVHRLKGLAEDGDIGKKEAQELRQWVARARELEEELHELQGRAPTAEDASALAARAIHEIGDAALAIKGGDPVKRAELQRVLTDLMGAATGEENLVSKTVSRAKELISELQEESAVTQVADTQAPEAAQAADVTAPEVPAEPLPGAETSLPEDIHADPVIPEDPQE